MEKEKLMILVSRPKLTYPSPPAIAAETPKTSPVLSYTASGAPSTFSGNFNSPKLFDFPQSHNLDEYFMIQAQKQNQVRL